MQYKLNEEQIKAFCVKLVDLLNEHYKATNDMYIAPKLDAIIIKSEEDEDLFREIAVPYAEELCSVVLPYTIYTLNGDALFNSDIHILFNDYRIAVSEFPHHLDKMAVLKLFFKYMTSVFGEDYIKYLQNHYSLEKLNKIKSKYKQYRQEERNIIESYSGIEDAINDAKSINN